MILQVIQLSDLENHKGREVSSYSPRYCFQETFVLGTEFTIYKESRIKHYLIIEEIGGYLYYHDVLQLSTEEFFPISTKVKCKQFFIRKNYTHNIENFLFQTNDMDLISGMFTPILPVEIIMDFIKTDIFNEGEKYDNSIPERLFDIYEHSFSEHIFNTTDYKHDYLSEPEKMKIGYFDSINLVDKCFNIMSLLADIRLGNGPKPGREKVHEVNYVTELIDQIAKHKLPNEKYLCIWKNLKEIINTVGIYHPLKDYSIPATYLSQLPTETIYRGHFSDSSVNPFPLMTLINLNVKDFLRFCDLYLPLNCEIIYQGNNCVKYVMEDEYFNTFLPNINRQMRVSSIEYCLNLEDNIDKLYYTILSELLAVLNYRTGLERKPYKKITKLNDNKVTLEIGDGYKEPEKYSWDLTLLHIADPIQYGIY